MILNFYCPERRICENENIHEIQLSSKTGMVQILPQHAALISKLGIGPFSYLCADGKLVRGVVSFGYFEVTLLEEVNVYAETVELATELNKDRAVRAREKALNMLSDATLDEQHFKKYQNKLFRSIARLGLFE